MSKKLFIHECGGDLGNMTTRITIDDPVDFALVVGKKSYRMHTDRNGNLEICLINGVNAEFDTYSGYPAIRLVQNQQDSENYYEHLRTTNSKEY